MKGFLQWIATVTVALIVIVGAERVPALKRADTFTELHRQPLVAVTLAVTILGFLVFMGGAIYWTIKDGAPAGAQENGETGEAGRNLMPVAGQRPFFFWYRFWGKIWAQGFEDHASFAEVKQARHGWWGNPRWRRNFVLLASGLTMGLGLFAFMAVLAPVGIKLLIGAAVLYAVVRLIWAFSRA
ncbi:MAG TPA: hypothetical protein VN176_05885 [Verrucomicrobiae bacterium]|jgi:hypothetical protein|nr:hypothetical protein [Verrucomicrobiae bacterium]